MSEPEHKIGDLLVRAKWHKRWNYQQSDICYGTIISSAYGQYVVHWWDNFIITKNVIYSKNEIREFKRILYQWILKSNENR